MSTEENSVNVQEIPQPLENNVQNNEKQSNDKKTQRILEGSPLECNICYEESDEPVTTMCGHIYCWACVYKWIQTKPDNKYCPVCKNTVKQDKIIPLYPKHYVQEKANAENTDGVPKRPYANREDRNATKSRGVGSNLFTGINIHLPNLAISIGCLPTILPILIMIIINLLACIFGDDEIISGDDYEPSIGEHLGRSSNSEDYYETDAFDWTVILIMIAFISLPFILSRFQRRR